MRAALSFHRVGRAVEKIALGKASDTDGDGCDQRKKPRQESGARSRRTTTGSRRGAGRYFGITAGEGSCGAVLLRMFGSAEATPVWGDAGGEFCRIGFSRTLFGEACCSGV